MVHLFAETAKQDLSSGMLRPWLRTCKLRSCDWQLKASIVTAADKV